MGECKDETPFGLASTALDCVTALIEHPQLPYDAVQPARVTRLWLESLTDALRDDERRRAS